MAYHIFKQGFAAARSGFHYNSYLDSYRTCWQAGHDAFITGETNPSLAWDKWYNH